MGVRNTNNEIKQKKARVAYERVIKLNPAHSNSRT